MYIDGSVVSPSMVVARAFAPVPGALCLLEFFGKQSGGARLGCKNQAPAGNVRPSQESRDLGGHDS